MAPTLDQPLPAFFMKAILLCMYIWHLISEELRSFFSPSKKEPSPSPPRTGSDGLKPAFQMFDRNGDGKITKTELNECLENMGIFIPDKDLSEMIGGDGCIGMDEFNALYQDIVGGGEEDIREAFDVFDQNGDGFISAGELKSVLASLGLKQGRATEDCEKMITRVDADGDGMVSFTEFKQMMRGGGFGALAN